MEIYGDMTKNSAQSARFRGWHILPLSPLPFYFLFYLGNISQAEAPQYVGMIYLETGSLYKETLNERSHTIWKRIVKLNAVRIHEYIMTRVTEPVFGKPSFYNRSPISLIVSILLHLFWKLSTIVLLH